MKTAKIAAAALISIILLGCGAAHEEKWWAVQAVQNNSKIIWKGYASEDATYWNVYQLVDQCLADRGVENNKVVPYVIITDEQPTVQGIGYDGAADFMTNTIYIWDEKRDDPSLFAHEVGHIVTGWGNSQHDNPNFLFCTTL